MNFRLATVQLSGMVMAAALAAAQGTRPSPALDPQARQRAEPPVHVLDFQPGAAISGMTPTSVMTMPFGCASNGTVLITMNNVEHGFADGSVTLYAVSGDKAVRVNPAAAQDIAVEQVTGFFPAGTQTMLHVFGHRRVTPAADKPRGAEFLLFFGSAGGYERSVEVPTELSASSVAFLPTGDLLIAGDDFTNRTDTLAIYDARGALLRNLDPPMNAKERQTGPLPRPNPTAFALHGDNVLAYRRGTRDPVLEVGQQNTVRSIPLALPPGAVISGMVSSDESFVVQSFPEMVVGKAVDTSTGTYYEFDPLDGSLLRALRSNKPLVVDMACKYQGHFTAFDTDRNNQFVRFTAP